PGGPALAAASASWRVTSRAPRRATLPQLLARPGSGFSSSQVLAGDAPRGAAPVRVPPPVTVDGLADVVRRGGRASSRRARSVRGPLGERVEDDPVRVPVPRGGRAPVPLEPDCPV